MPGLTPQLLGLALPFWLAATPPGDPTSLALQGERVLLGTRRGLYAQVPEGWTLLHSGEVRDLAASVDELLIATADGLYAWPAGAHAPRRVELATGSGVRAVALREDGSAWVAADGGLFTRAPGARRFERELGLPAAEVASVRLAAGALWVATAGTLWVRRGNLPFARIAHGLEPGWWELRGAVRGQDEVLLAVPSGLWRVGADTVRRLDLGIGTLHGLCAEGRTLYVASERGVYAYPLDRLGSALAEPSLYAPTYALAHAERRVLAATLYGVAVVPIPAAPARPAGLRGPGASPRQVDHLRRAVLAYLELSPTRLRQVEERARSAAWWPQVRATFALDRDWSNERDSDEVYSGGSVHGLLDNTRQSDREVGFDLQLVWQLARGVTPDQALDISRERRQLVQLRDQILERVNRLYFERERVLARLAALEPDVGDRSELELRELELRAQLDGWSGGMFSRLVSGAGEGRTP